jgi:hypothetical protein
VTVRGARVAFATEELHPFGAGGIGRLVHHLVHQGLEAGASVHLFLASTLQVSDAQLAEVFGPGVTASRFEAHDDQPLVKSLALAAHVAEFCARHEPFEWIELPDFRGLGFATLHRAACEGLVGSPQLHVRIHGPNSVIAWHEEQRIDAVRALEFDLERSSLLLADTVFAPMAPVRDAVADFFHLDARWRERVRLALPPRSDRVTSPSPAAPPRTQIVFPTPAQGIKRPDLFIEGVTRLMQKRPHWRGKAILAAHRSPEIEASLLQTVPTELRTRFEWASWNEEERARNFAGQIVVVPSDFETLSLAAWEAATAGAQLVASTQCPAFADGSPWTKWSGFHGFAGGPSAVAGALERALDAAESSALNAEASPFPRATSLVTGVRLVSSSEITTVVGDRDEWTEQLSRVTTPWVLLLRAPNELDSETFCSAAARALSRRPQAELVSAAGTRLGSPTQAWASMRPPAGPVVAKTELARKVISTRHGRRALVATAAQLGLECLSLFVPVRELPSDDERFPPATLDVHPFAVRAQRDGALPLRQQLLERARTSLSRQLRKFRSS